MRTITLRAAASFAAALLVLVALGATEGAAAGGVYLIYSQNDQSEAAAPPSLVVDNHDGLTNLRWSRWGGVRALAHGTLSYDDCKPDCARGHQHTTPAEVIATAPSACGAGTFVYTRVSFSAHVGWFKRSTPLPSYSGKPSSCAGGGAGVRGGSSWTGASAMTGSSVGDCIGIDSGDVLDSDGYGDSFGRTFWDPLHLEAQVQHHALGGISAYSNHISIYFWNSKAEATRVYAAAGKQGVRPLRQYGNAVMVGYQDLSPLQRHVVDRCLVAGG